ncbi:MAG: hypothetical protein IKA23_01085 [Akkermansia sp.]|nr:hypothetical protein [Akkermansia sp.]
MKKALVIFLLGGLLVAPVFSQDAALDKVTAMAQEKSGASLDALSMAVYEAVKAQPQKAVDVFQGVMTQRKSWTVTETYAILRSVLLASPSLEASFVQNAAVYQSGGASGYSVSVVDSLGSQLVAALYTLPQTQAVASTVVQGVVGSASVGRAAGNGVSAEVLDAYVPVAPSAPSAAPEYSVTPTPPPTSVNN